MERVFDICHGCRRCVSLCERVSDAVRPRRRKRDDGGRRRREGRLREGRRPVLSVRRLLHDQVSVRSAASVERRLSASDAAREGGQVQEGRNDVPRPAADQHRSRRQARDDSRRREDGEQGEHDARRAQGDGQGAGRRCGGRAAAVRRADLSRVRGGIGRLAGARRAAHAGQGRDLLDLLRELQRARDRPRPLADSRAQRDPVPVVEKEACCGMPKLELGDFEAVERLKNVNIPVLAGLRARRLRDPDRGAVVHADVQVRAAAALPRGSPT